MTREGGGVCLELIKVAIYVSAVEAFIGPCTAKTTIYCANIAAGLMVAQFTKHLRQLPVGADVQMNLLASELSVA